MEKKKKRLALIFILIIVFFIIYNFILERTKYDGYCKIEGTYQNRYVRCYGNYSPKAKNRAQKKLIM